MITTTIISILSITVLVWLANRALGAKICAGVSLTWIVMLAARYLGYEIDPVILAMLMGASVVGLAYQLEKKLQTNRLQLLWKTFFIPSGFLAAYGLVYSNWPMFLGAMAWLLVLIYAFLYLPKFFHGNNKKVKELEKKMEQCC